MKNNKNNIINIQLFKYLNIFHYSDDDDVNDIIVQIICCCIISFLSLYEFLR